MTVLGVDGWKGRWVVAVADGRRLEWHTRDTFGDILGDWPGITVAVDMPMATTEGPRDVDTAGRAWLREHGGPWQSIFLTPTSAVVAAQEAGRNHAEAMAERAAGTPGTSIQAWHLIPSIIQVRNAIASFDSTVIEAHPECSFRAMDDRIGLASKKTGLGAGERLRALLREFDVDLATAPPGVPVDDLLDACAVAWTAGRYDRGESFTLPDRAAEAPRIVI